MKTVCVDLDGTLAQYDGWKGLDHIGDPIHGAKEFLHELKSIPVRVVIWTTRTNSDLNKESTDKLKARVIEWLNRHNLPFDDVSTDEAKLLCLAFVDDRAITCRPQDGIYTYRTALHQIKGLLDYHE